MANFIPQSSLPDVWSWGEFLRAVIGPIIAAVFVVIGIWLKEIFDRRKAAQAWYEEHYVTEALDQYIAHILNLDILLTKRRTLKPHATPQFDLLPSSTQTRVLTLLGDRMVLVLVTFLEYGLTRKNEKEGELTPSENEHFHARIRLCHDLNLLFETLRGQLLKLKIKNKSEIYKICKRPEIASLVVDITNRTNKAVTEVGMKAFVHR